MALGPFARRRQAKKDDDELGHELWRRAHDWFRRSLDRYWQVVNDAEGSVPREEHNGLVNAGNVLTDVADRVRRLCVRAQQLYPGSGMDVPSGAQDVHRVLSRAANHLATVAQAAAMFRLGQTDVLTVGRRAERVIEDVEEAERLAARWEESIGR